jgi:mono/diheme cytochrome c family protein
MMWSKRAAVVTFLTTLMLFWANTPGTRAGVVQNASATYKSVYNGWKVWHVYCYRCHGTNAVATTLAPDLLDPNLKLVSGEFLKKVRNGNPDKGMPAWNKLLENSQIADVFLYVRARSEKVLPPGRPDEIGPNAGPWVPPPGWPK